MRTCHLLHDSGHVRVRIVPVVRIFRILGIRGKLRAVRSAGALRLAAGVCAAMTAGAVVPAAEVPAAAFTGVYGATAGAGSLTGWARHGGDNPAVLSSPGYGVSLAGHAPFGLPGLRVTELAASRDAARWGLSLAWRHLADKAGGDASSLQAQMAFRVRPGAHVGVAATRHRSEDGIVGGGDRYPDQGGQGAGGGGGLTSGWSAGAGALLSPHPALGLGVAGELTPHALGRRVRLGGGVDAGTSLATWLGPGARWRMTAEYAREWERGHEAMPGAWRFAASVLMHPALGVHAGYAPGLETLALGVAFGIGGWEGYSAVRRHSALGGTTVQGLSWSSSRR